MADRHSFVGFLDRPHGLPGPACSCGGPWDLYSGVCLVQDRERRQVVVEQFTAALLTGLDELPRHNGDGTCIGAGNVADLVHKVAREVRGG